MSSLHPPPPPPPPLPEFPSFPPLQVMSVGLSSKSMTASTMCARRERERRDLAFVILRWLVCQSVLCCLDLSQFALLHAFTPRPLCPSMVITSMSIFRPDNAPVAGDGNFIAFPASVFSEAVMAIHPTAMQMQLTMC